MDNQHRQIKGYRELTQEEIDLMNEIKQQGVALRSSVFQATHPNGEVKQFVGNDEGCAFFKVSAPTWLGAVKRGERDGWKIERLGTVAELGLSV